MLKFAHTQKNSNVFAYMLRLTYNTYTHTAKAQLSFRAYTDRRDAVNRLISRIFRPIYTQRNHTQSSNSALFTCWTHIQHTHIYCKGTTQLLHTYTSMQCSKSIDFLFSDQFTCVAKKISDFARSRSILKLATVIYRSIWYIKSIDKL